jgi:UDP-GlcNAc:undecaprenyl-phosphate GlcNAc-1-phosphate transferase
MTLFTSFFFALLISMLLVPTLRRRALWLGLIDTPDPRKVHKRLVPRSGGLAIVAGALLPIMLWFPGDPLLRDVLSGGLIIAIFGYFDDRLDLDYRIKFVGQALAAVVAMHGGLLMNVWPFIGIDPVSPLLAAPVTFLFLLGVTNALNFSDGLDGLAGGISLVTLGAIAFIAYASEGYGVALMAIAIMGGVCGFLRYNNYPAVIFMGDTGSQFLGFMTAGLAIVLTQHLDTALNPALVLLLLGLPVLDLLSVMFWRVRRGQSPFRPDRSHFHHRLLDHGFRHYEAVATIYVAQALLVLAALPVRFEADTVVVGIYVTASVAILGFFRWARVTDWQLRAPPPPGQFVERRNLWIRRLEWLPHWSARGVELGVAGMMMLAAVSAVPGSRLLSLISLAAGGALVLSLILGGRWRRHLRRGALYVSALIAVFILQSGPGHHAVVSDLFLNGFTLLIAVALVAAIRVTRRERFSTSPLDILILLFVIVALVVNERGADTPGALDVDEAVARLAVLFYAAELLFSKGNRYLNALSGMAGVAMLAVGVRASLG